MVTNFCRQRIIKFLQGTGVTLVEGGKNLVNGNPESTIIVKDSRLYKAVLLKGFLKEAKSRNPLPHPLASLIISDWKGKNDTRGKSRYSR